MARQRARARVLVTVMCKMCQMGIGGLWYSIPQGAEGMSSLH